VAKLSEKKNEFVKLMYIGGSGSGKTGSLVSLVKAGYNLRILDMDNGIDSLAAYVQRECPERMDAVDYQSYRDKFRADPIKGIVVDGAPKAYTSAIKALNKWDDGTIPSEWGPSTVFVLDTLTSFSRAAFLWAQGMNPGAKDPRQWFGAAQESVRTVLELLTSAEFRAHVIVISHVDLVEQADGTTRGYASSIGKAMGPQIPKYFNTLILAESRGSGENVKRTIQTVPTSLIDLKNPKPFDVPKALPLESGLATLFEKLAA